MLAEDYLQNLKPAPGDEPKKPNAMEFLDAPGGQARLTVYTRFDDGPEYYDGRTAKANPLTGHAKAQEGVTIAVDPEVIPYGSKVRIPSLAEFSANGDGIFIAHDTGGAVRSRKASGGKEPVIDVYVEGANPEQAGKRRDALANALGTKALDYEVVEEGKPLRKLTAEEYLDGAPRAMTPAELDRDFGGKIKSGDKLPDRYAHDVDVPEWRNRSAESFLDAPDETPGVLDHLSNAIERGYLQYRLAREMQKEKPIPTTVAALEGMLGEHPSSPDLDAFNNAGSAAEALKAFANAPLQITSELVAESMASFLPMAAVTVPGKVAKGVAIGAGTGAAAGSVVPGAGTLAGAVSGASYGARAGFIEGAGETSYALETSSKILETLQESGIDVTNDKALAQAFADPDLMEKARTKAKRKGLPVALFDAFSAAIGGRLFSTPARSILGKIGHTAAEVGTQAVLGMAGEAAGQLNAGEQLNAPAILAEGIGELGPGSVEVATGAMSRTHAPTETAPVRQAAVTAPTEAPSLSDVAVSGDPVAEMEAPTPTEEVPVEGDLPSLLSELEEEGQTAPSIQPQAPTTQPEPAAVPASPAPETTVTDADRKRLVREYSFPRDLADYVMPEDMSALFAERPGTLMADGLMQSAMHKAHIRFLDASIRRVTARMAGARAKPNAPVKSVSDADRARLVRDYSFPRGLADYVTPEEVAALFAERPGTRKTEPVLQAAMKNAEARMREAESTVDAPFSLKPSADVFLDTPDVEEARAIGRAATKGWAVQPQVLWHQSVDDLPQDKVGRFARRAALQNSFVEGYWQNGKMYLVADDIAQFAAQQGVSFEQRVREVILHEAVGHGGIGAVLDSKGKRALSSIVDGVLAQIPEDEKTTLATSYGYDLNRADQRSRLAEEWLARQIERGVPQQSWIARVIAQIRDLLRAALPGLQVTENDVAYLLSQGWKRTQTPGVPVRGQGFSLGRDGAQFSVQPRGEAQVPGPSAGQRRQFIDKVKASAAMAPQVKAQVESIYQPLSDKTAIEEAKTRIAEIGIDAAEREVLAINSTNNPPTKRSNVLALQLLGMLNASGEYDRAAAIAMHIAENNTSQAQAIQSMALFARLGPEGIQAYTAKVIQQAVKTGGFTEETQKLHAELERLKAELAKERGKGATSAILDAQDMLKAAGFTAEKLADLQRKLRAALLQSMNEPGNARTRIVGLLIAAGMDRKKAERLADKVVKEAQRQAKQARDRALRQMLRLKQGLPTAPKLESDIQERIRQTMISNPGSLWARYRAQAAKQVGNTAALLADPGLRVQTPALQDFSARLVRQLAAQLPKEARPKTEQDAVALLSEAVTNADKYTEVWNEARRHVAEKYKGNPQMLDKLDKLVGHQLERPFSEATMQRAVDQALKSLDTSVRDLLTRSHLDKNVAKAQLVSLLQDRTGVSGAQAAQLGGDILKAWDQAETKARTAYAKGLFKDPIAKVSKSELQKWIEMNNAGLLDDSKFYAQIAAKYGLPVFTETEARRIAELQRRFDQAADGDAKLVAGARMMDAVHSLVPAGFWSKVNSVRNLAMLLNPKTSIRNIGGNAVLFLTDTAADALNSWVIDPAVSLVTGKHARSSAAIGARLSGLAQPWRDFWAGVEHGKAEGHTGKLQLFADGAAYLRDLARVTQHGIWDSKDFTKSFRHTFSSRTMRLFEDSLAIVLGSADRAFHAAAFQSSITNQLAAAKANGEEHLAPTPAMIEQALLDANRAVLQDQNWISATLVKTKRALNVIGVGKPIDPKTGQRKMGESGEFGLGSAVIPFGQVPGSVVMRGVEYSPIGFVRALYETPLGTIFGRTGAFDQKAFSEAFSRALLGTAGVAMGALLLRLGVISALPDDEKDREAMRRSAGLGGLRVNVSELLRRLLTLNFHTPASMFEAAQDGDVVISYDWMQPAAFSVAAGAQAVVEQNRMAEAAQTGKIPATSSAFIAGFLGSSRAFEQMSVLSGLKRFSQSTGQRQSLVQALGEQFLTLPASFIPTVVKDLNSVIDNTVRETRADTARHPLDATVNAVLERIPGTAHRFPPRYDAFGEAMQRYQAGGNVLFNAFLNPAFTSEVRKTPVLRELERTYAATLEPGVTPSSPNRIVAINGRQRELTNEELAHFKYFVGRLASQRMGDMIASPVWHRLPESVKAKYIAEAFSDAAAAGKIMLFGDRPKQPDRTVVRAAAKARQMGLERRPWN